MHYIGEGTNRYMCEVIDEIKNIITGRMANWDGHPDIRAEVFINSLLEEIRAMGERMESALGDKRQLDRRTSKLRSLKKEIRELKKEVQKLEDKKENLEDG